MTQKIGTISFCLLAIFRISSHAKLQIGILIVMKLKWVAQQQQTQSTKKTAEKTSQLAVLIQNSRQAVDGE